MKMILALLVLWGSAAVAVEGDAVRVETRDGRVYEGVRAIRVNAGEIRFIHAEGAAAVPLAELTRELRERYGYDEAAARWQRERRGHRRRRP